MRISDWSSDVCSSDLPCIADRAQGALLQRQTVSDTRSAAPARSPPDQSHVHPGATATAHPASLRALHVRRSLTTVPTLPLPRSEEHTSELQSLMRISYAVFCLKKKKHSNVLI